MEKNIRSADKKDLRAIYSLLQEGVLTGKVLERSIKELKTVIENFFVYLEDDKVVGCCSLEIYNKKLAEIRSLVVLSRYRNRGVGSALIKTCLEKAGKNGIYQVLSVTDKINLFKRFGFRTKVNKKQALFLNINKNRDMGICQVGLG